MTAYSLCGTLHWEGETGGDGRERECSICHATYSSTETHVCVIPRGHPQWGKDEIRFMVDPDADFEVVYSAAPFTIERSATSFE